MELILVKFGGVGGEVKEFNYQLKFNVLQKTYDQTTYKQHSKNRQHKNVVVVKYYDDLVIVHLHYVLKCIASPATIDNTPSSRHYFPLPIYLLATKMSLNKTEKDAPATIQLDPYDCTTTGPELHPDYYSLNANLLHKIIHKHIFLEICKDIYKQCIRICKMVKWLCI